MNLLVILIVCFFSISNAHATEVSEIKKNAAKTIDSAVEYTKEQKEEVQVKLQNSLDEISLKIKNLKEKASVQSGETKKSFESQVHKLEVKREQAEKKLLKLKLSTGKAWNEIKLGVSSALSKLADSYEKAKASLKE
jgi:hypothetical protein